MRYEQLQHLYIQKTSTPLRETTMEKVIRTYTVSESREVLSVTVNTDTDTTDIIEQVILSEGDTVVSNQKLRTTMPTAEARDIITAASKGA